MKHVDARSLFEAVDEGMRFNEKDSKHLQACDDCRRLLWGYSHQQVQKLQRHTRRSRKVVPFKVAA